jgi:hypothetical protein
MSEDAKQRPPLTVIPLDVEPAEREWRRARSRRLTKVALAGALALVTAAAVASVPFLASRSGPIPPADAAASVSPDPNQLAGFLADCDKGVSRWQVGQIDYPEHLSLEMGQSAAYVVAVDIRNNPLPAERVIPGASPQSAPIAVQCVLSARLAPVGQSLEVNNREWILREFTPTGVLNWSWSITARAPDDQEVRLELQPAVITRGKFILPQGDSSLDTSSFVTRVNVTATWIQRVGHWWNDNWGIISLVIVAVGAALVSIIKWSGNLGEAVHDTSAKWRGAQK